MGLATPTALLVGTGRGAQLGILIKGPEILESTRTIDTVVLDKTGTLTTGRMTLAGVAAAPGEDPAEVLRLAGAVEDASGHPIAAAIAAGARDRLGTGLPGVENFTSHHGLGVSGVADGHAVVAGRQDWITAEWAQPIPAGLAARGARGGAGRADGRARRVGRPGPRRAGGHRHDQAHVGGGGGQAAPDGPGAGAAHRG